MQFWSEDDVLFVLNPIIEGHRRVHQEVTLMVAKIRLEKCP